MDKKNQILKTCQDLIRFKTTPDNIGELNNCANYIMNFFKDTNYSIQKIVNNDIPNVVITKNTKTPKIFLCGHFDVVAATDEDFEPKEDQGMLYGRGSADMKSGDAVMMMLMKELENSNLDFGLMLTGDEEEGGFNGTKYLISQGYNCEAAVIPDGGKKVNGIVIKEKGILRIILTAKGISAHGAYPWQGKNAFNILNKSLIKIENLFKPIKNHPKDHWETTLNIGKVSSGDAFNKIPDKAEAFLDIRFTEKYPAKKIISNIKNILPKEINMQVKLNEASVFVDQTSKYFLNFKKSVEKIKQNFEFAIDHGASDARHFNPETVILMNQPDGYDFHGVNERVSIQGIYDYYDILLNFIKTSS